MAYASTTTRAESAVGQREGHVKTISRQLAEQFRTVQNPSFDTFKSFARDYVNVCLASGDSGTATDSLSAADQMELAHALRIDLPADTTAEAKPGNSRSAGPATTPSAILRAPQNVNSLVSLTAGVRAGQNPSMQFVHASSSTV